MDEKRLRERIEKRVNADLRENKIGNASVLVTEGEKTVYQGFFGEVKWKSGETPNENTAYRLASMTKPITAVAILILKERGLLSLEDLVETYIPEYATCRVGRYKMNELIGDFSPKQKPRILHLLTHTSGIGNRADGAPMTAADKKDLQSAVAYHATRRMAFEPSTQASYSPTAGFDILARIVELVSGKTFAQFLKEEIFSPLGMKDTTFEPTPSFWTRMSYMHDRVEGKSVEAEGYRRRIFSDHPIGYFCGGAGLASTLSDYRKFTQALLFEGAYRGERILSPESVRALRTPQVSEAVMPLAWRWGLGVRVITKEGQRLPVGAYGWSGAYGGHFWIDPKNQITAIYLKNSLFDGGSGALTAAHFEEDVYEE